MLSSVQEERKKTTFDPLKLTHAIYGQKDYERLVSTIANFDRMYQMDLNISGRGRVEMIKESIRAGVMTGATTIPGNDSSYLPTIIYDQLQVPASVHVGMFIPCIQNLGTEAQQAELLPKCYNLEIVGCYAQTELGHGSDVQGLETTAELDTKTDELVINTPKSSAAKFWPGDLGVYANHALVFARLIISSESSGIFPFLVKIRDQEHKLMPGVEAGDIGPKFGFSTKDNGYLILNNVRIPRKNMLRKYVSVSKEGEIKIKGNPKISYATMMMVRRTLSCGYTKLLGSGLIIAGRYSIMRKQFKDDRGQEIPIMQYQLQQNKLISCLADFYAISAGARRISQLVDDNFKLVSEKDDDSLMAETHICLCMSKAYWTDMVLRDLETCRLACGGHGFSHYSGLPVLIQDFAPNVTLQGENSVLTMQLSRFLLKSFKKAKSKKEITSASVKYLESYQFFQNRKCQVEEGAAKQWQVEDLRILLAQSVCYLLQKSVAKIQQHADLHHKTAEDRVAALTLVQASIMHSAYFTFTSLQHLAIGQSDQILRPVLYDLCLLFGINVILNKPHAIIQNRAIQPHHMKSLQECKQNLLSKIRPHFIGLLDAIGIPEPALKSALVSGTNIYENLLKLARKSDVNQEINPGVWILKKGLTNCRPRL